MQGFLINSFNFFISYLLINFHFFMRYLLLLFLNSWDKFFWCIRLNYDLFYMKFWFRFNRQRLSNWLCLFIYFFHLDIFIGKWICNLINIDFRCNFLWNSWCIGWWNLHNNRRFFDLLLLNFFNHFFCLFLLFDNLFLFFYLLGFLFLFYWGFLFIQDWYLEESKFACSVNLKMFRQFISNGKNSARLSNSKSDLEECCYLHNLLLLFIKWDLDALAIS